MINELGRVGKTSISIKYVRNEFDDKQKETINASYLEKKVKLNNSQTVKLTIWVSIIAFRILQGRNSTTQLLQSTIGKPLEPLFAMISHLSKATRRLRSG